MNPNEDQNDPNNNALSQPDNAGANDNPGADLHPRIKQLTEKLHEKDAQLTETNGKVAKLESALADLQEKINDRRSKDDDFELTADEEAQLNRIERGLKGRGFVTEEKFESDRQATKLSNLQDKHNGKDGLPKFVPDDVVVYAKRHGFGSNYEAAYRDMHYDAILQIEADRRAKGITPPTSERPTGQAEQDNSDKGSVSAEDIENMSDADYEKQREGLLRSMKQASKD